MTTGEKRLGHSGASRRATEGSRAGSKRGSLLQRQVETRLVGLGLEPVFEAPLLRSGDDSLFDRGEAAQRLIEPQSDAASTVSGDWPTRAGCL